MLPNESEIASRVLTPVARVLRLVRVDAAPSAPTSDLFALVAEDVKEEALARGVGHTNALDIDAPTRERDSQGEGLEIHHLADRGMSGTGGRKRGEGRKWMASDSLPCPHCS